MDKEEFFPCVARRARASDLARIVSIDQRCFSVPWSEAAFRYDLEDNPLATYYLVLAGADVGDEQAEALAYASWRALVDEAEILNIGVVPEARRRGIGRALMDLIKHDAKAASIKRLILEVRRSNTAAQTLYINEGFRPCGLRPKYYTDNGEDAILMEFVF